jgi:hypothetical protein
MILSILKAVGPPGSTRFLAVCVAAGVLMYVWPRKERIARRWLIGVLSGYLFLGLPVVANAIADRLPRIDSRGQAIPSSVDTLVIFDGDNRRGRVREALASYRNVSPRTVWILGSLWLVDSLVAGGIPAERIRHEWSPPTTRDQVTWVTKLVAGSQTGRIGIVASRLQMPRLSRLTQAVGLQVVLISSPVDTEPPRRGFRLYLPSYTALRVSRDALYEHAALSYYRRQGWIKPS